MEYNEKYLEALINNDSSVILEIYTKFYPKIAAFIVGNKGGHEDAQDVFQDALVYLIYVYEKKAIQINSFEAYLFTICKNIWRRRLRDKKEWTVKDGVYPLIDKTTKTSLFILEQQREELYNESFAKLSDNCRDVLSLYFNTMNYENLLDTFSYNSVDVARHRVFKCRKKLMQLIKRDKQYHSLKE
ncbi:MAG: RNA polymerase sigma factor [Kordia sp.]|uniref:RNA polymerase sigma factor n=1 Tax=Kordia sp. TaxID=1965332 RepID=UPI00385D90F0